MKVETICLRSRIGFSGIAAHTVMINDKDINNLFNETCRGLRRSVTLLEEKCSKLCTRGASFAVEGVSFKMRKSDHSRVITTRLRSVPICAAPVFLQSLNDLRTVARFFEFVDSSTVLLSHLSREMNHPSGSSIKQRVKGEKYVLTKKILSHLVLPSSCVGSAADDACHLLWWTGAEDDSNAGSEMSVRDACCGASLRSLVVATALATDCYHSAGRASTLASSFFEEAVGDSEEKKGHTLTHATDWWALDNLSTLLHRSTAHYSSSLKDALLTYVSQLYLSGDTCLPHYSSASGVHSVGVSSGMLLFPSVIPSLVVGDAARLLTKRYLEPLAARSARLVAIFLGSESSKFEEVCSLHVQSLLLGIHSLLSFLLFEKRAKTQDSSGPRIIQFARDAVDAALEGVEKEVRSPRHPAVGMTQMLAVHLVLPLCRGLKSIHSRCKEKLSHDDVLSREREGFESTIQTAMYRLWMVLEETGTAELSRSGTARHAESTSRKRNRILLQQSGGKITLALLRAAAEDRQVLLTETSARSSGGCVVYKAQSSVSVVEGEACRPVFLYLEEGSIYFKVGRAPKFEMARSVSHLFESLVE